MTLALIAALPAELRPLTRGWQQRDGLLHGRIGPHDAVAACDGIGAAAAARAVERVLSSASAAAPIDTLLSIGFAGSLSCGLRPPDAVSVREVIDAATGESFPALALPSGDMPAQRLVTVTRVAGPQEKRRLATLHHAALVDMEAATVARLARDRGLRFLCIKAITDGPNNQLPDFDRFTTPGGRLRTAAFVAWAAVHPGTWSPLHRLGTNSRLAAQALADFLSRSLPPSII